MERILRGLTNLPLSESLSAGGSLDEVIKANSQNIRRMAERRQWKAAIVIPALNEEKRLPLCLASVDYALGRIPDTPIQVLIVDNGSTDNTSTIASSFGATVVDEEREGVGIARQKGLEHIDEGVKHVLTTDADTIVESYWVSAHIKALSQKGVVGSYGRSYDRLEGNVNPIDQILLTLFQKIGDRVHDYKRKKGVILSLGNNSAYSRDVALEAGGYLYEHASEDLEIMLRLKEKGEVRFTSDAIVYPSARRITSTVGLRRYIMDRLLFNLRTGFSAQFELLDEDRIDYR